MKEGSIYNDIAKRTGGDIYIGVVGPVRSGKSTFIKRFMECAVLPAIENDYDRQRTIDCMPQGAGGKTVMTTEPKLVPEEAVRITAEGGTELNVKLIDCVGYMVEGALGGEENGEVRMINTPWSDEPIPFTEAAKTGTSKVISEHSTIGILVTTDGTVTDLERGAYVDAEERCVKELSELGKPFAIVLNSKNPESEAAKALAHELEEKYSAPVALVSCPELDATDIREIIGLVLGEFPVCELKIHLPSWAMALPEEHPIRRELYARVDAFSNSVKKIGDITEQLIQKTGARDVRIDAGDGTGELALTLDENIYYSTVLELTGLDVSDKKNMLKTLCELSEIKEKYGKIEAALNEADTKGYGIVIPGPEDMTLEEPRMIKEAGGFGVRVTAEAETLHIIKAGIRADVCPVVGSKEQTEEVIKQLCDEYDEAPENIFSYSLFGRTMYDLVKDGMRAKLEHMPDEARLKLGETLERIINEGAGGLICILL